MAGSEALTGLFKGYVTAYSAVCDQGARALERRLGFDLGSLHFGWEVWSLIDPVGPEEWVWRDQTTYSGGWRWDAGIGEYVQRRDEMRAAFGRRTGYDEAASDELIAGVMADHQRRLNVRTGPDRIVKVVPRRAGRIYPDSPMRGIPQWELKHPKRFCLMAAAGGGSIKVSV